MWTPLIFLTLYLGVTNAARSSYGREFAAVFSSTRSDYTSGSCNLQINALADTAVTISSSTGSNTYNIDASSTNIFNQDFSTTFRTESGIESNAIYVTSEDADISVTLSNFRESDIGEAMLVLPRDDNELEFYVLTYPYESDSICSSASTTVFYSVAAFEDATTVEVYNLFAGSYVLRTTTTLDRSDFEVFTERETKASTVDYTGFKIVANKPVSVTGGNACADIHTLSSVSGPIWASMPALGEAGTTFISHPLERTSGVSPDYTLRVLAVSDNTEVNIRDAAVTTTLDEGEFYNYVVDGSFEDEVITCSNPCFVAQIGMADSSAIFMVNLPSTSQYVTSAKFTAPDFNTATSSLDYFVSIILLSNSPSTSGMTIDGTDISGNSGWVSTNEYSYLVYEYGSVEEIVHVLESNVPFSALVNGQGSTNGDGYGYMAAVTSSGSSPPGGEKIPIYRLQMYGDFTGTAEIDSSCSATYSQVFNQLSTSMIQTVNDRIGTVNMCSDYTTNDVSLIYVSTVLAVSSDNTTGRGYLGYVMNVNTETTSLAGVESCGQDMTDFLLPHSNWPNSDPLPDQPGCPGVSFNGNQFTQSDSGNEWVCPVVTSQDPDTYAVPKYSLGHSGSFSTTDGSTIETGCSLSYSQSFSSSTQSQLQAVNNLIASGSLCTVGKDGDVTLQTVTTSISTDNDSGSTYQTYVFQLAGEASTSYLYSCAAEVSTYLQPHSNWNDPIIAAPGCPAVEFSPTSFNEEVQQWIC